MAGKDGVEALGMLGPGMGDPGPTLSPGTEDDDTPESTIHHGP